MTIVYEGFLDGEVKSLREENARLKEENERLNDVFGPPRPALNANWHKGPNGQVFLSTPYAKGLYILTDACVVHVRCPVCSARVLEPCFGKHGYWTSTTHWKRRVEWTKKRRNK